MCTPYKSKMRVGFSTVSRAITRVRHVLVAVLLALSAPAWAGNTTLATYITAAEPTMGATAAHCEPDEYRFVSWADVEVSQTGAYEVADAGQNLTGGLDGILAIYENSFDPTEPMNNLVALFDAGYNSVAGDFGVELTEGKIYIFVVSVWCNDIYIVADGPSAFVLTGPGELIGAGFPTRAEFYGDFAEVTDVADFANLGGERKYVSRSFTASRSGVYRFTDPSWQFDGWVTGTLVYSSFDPLNPAANIVAFNGTGTTASYFLAAGQSVEVVTVDIDEGNSRYQLTVFSPGELKSLNPFVAGTYFNPDMRGQGLLLDMDASLNVLFLALYTFEAGNASTLQSSVGSSDQRWLTAYGSYDPASLEVNLKWERATGGSFNADLPKATIDSNYGSGFLTVENCQKIELTYQLPDVPDGRFEMVRGLPAMGERCSESLVAGLPEPW